MTTKTTTTTTSTTATPAANDECALISIHDFYNAYCDRQCQIVDIRVREQYDQLHVMGSVHVDVQDAGALREWVVDHLANSKVREFVCVGGTREQHVRVYRCCRQVVEEMGAEGEEEEEGQEHGQLRALMRKKKKKNKNRITFRSVMAEDQTKAVWTAMAGVESGDGDGDVEEKGNDIQQQSTGSRSNSNSNSSDRDFFTEFAAIYGFVCESSDHQQLKQSPSPPSPSYPNVILPHKLFLGTLIHREQLNKQQTADGANPIGITHVLNITHTRFDPIDGLTEMRIAIDDSVTVSIRDHFSSAIAFIHNALASDGDGNSDNSDNNRVLVHCQAGISRSASVVIAYLMSRHRYSLYSAYEHVMRCRRIIHPNDGFMEQLAQVEREIYGEESSTMAVIEKSRMRKHAECVVQ